MSQSHLQRLGNSEKRSGGGQRTSNQSRNPTYSVWAIPSCTDVFDDSTATLTSQSHLQRLGNSEE